LVYCDDGRPPIRYDVLSIDIGITPKTLSIDSMNSLDITPVKPIDRFGDRWESVIRRLQEEQSSEDSCARKYSTTNPLKFIVVGGGAGGIELAFVMKQRLKKELNDMAIDVSICTRGESIATSHGR
jgi:selenide, water dikinase